MPSSFREMGYPDFSSRSYVVQAWLSADLKSEAKRFCLESDVAIFGGTAALSYEVMRARTGKLTFDVGEHWMKKGVINLFSPRFLQYYIQYLLVLRSANVYKLCASARVSHELRQLGCFRGKCFKWGYFPAVLPLDEVLEMRAKQISNQHLRLMWCGRFLPWKHPEHAILVAKHLKCKNYSFTLDMYGMGEELEKCQSQVQKEGLSDVVRFKGCAPNDYIREQMLSYDIYLFTSDQNEGWGCVANEAMACGCVLVSSDAVGSAPYLVKDGKNGFLYRMNHLEELIDRVEWLFHHQADLHRISVSAVRTMNDQWSPKRAAQQFQQLINYLISGSGSPAPYGPGSRA